MMAQTSIFRFSLAVFVSLATSAMAQNGGGTFPAPNSWSSPTGRDCSNGKCSPPGSFGPSFGSFNSHSRDVASDIDNWNTPAAGSFRPASTSGMVDFPELPASLSRRRMQNVRNTPASPRVSQIDGGFDWRNDYGTPLDSFSEGDFGRYQQAAPEWSGGARVPADPFRRPLDGVRGGDYFDDTARGDRQSRYRIPLDRSNDGLELPGRSDWGPGRQDFGGSEGQYGPVSDDQYVPMPGRDPFVPAPVPSGRMDSESEAINKMLSVRYQNPVNVRAVRSMSANQAMNLFAEVSQKIDERHLQPTSYDLRVRRALRNLSLALDNPAFLQGLGISGDSFRTDSFRNTLASLAGSMQVAGYQDAKTVMSTVMQQAQAVPGMSPSVVAFEFANASIDTLDKFSGIEPADPGVPGASLESGTKSASLEDEIVGVGVEIKEHASGLLVVKALRGGPAAEAGVEAGDLIVAINGRNIEGMPMANSVDLMKGGTGSSMVVRIFRANKGERNFTLTRRKFRVWTVNDTRLLQGTDVGYLSLSRFAQNSTAELDQALSDLNSQGMKSLIIDLRGNPGGLLTTCVEISDRFVPCGTIVSTKGRLASDNMLEKANWSRTWSMPLVVLVDGDSASASEIFAAAIQENQRGVVVGTKSYGKGSVQTHFPMSAISGSLRLTTAKFYSPNGREMADQGVTPDVLINDPDGIENGDQVLARALQIAGSRQLLEMARAAGTCRDKTPSAARSSSLKNINDSIHVITAVR